MTSSVAATVPIPPAKRGESPGVKWLERALFALIFLVALFAPVWTKAAVLFFRLALVAWIVKLVWLRPKLPSLPIVRPLLAYLLLVVASTLFSPLPILSWGRMRTIELFLLALLVACNLRRPSQAKALVLGLTFSTLIAVSYAGWMQFHGIGVRVAQPTPALVAAGLRSTDAIISVNGSKIHNARDWKRAVAAGRPLDELRILRGEPGERVLLNLQHSRLIASSSNQAIAVETARLPRARGFFYSYIPFAEILMLMSLLAFGICISSAQARKRAPAIAWGIIFAVFLAGLVATETRAAVAAVLLVSVAALWLVSGWKLRAVSVALLALLVVAGGFWFRAERAGLGWIGARDPGTEYRLLMWKDGVRLALEHPLLGIGMDTVEHRGRELDIAAYKKYPNLKSHFHSTYIQIAAECGLPALAAWIWLMVALMWLSWKAWRRPGPGAQFENGLALGMMCATLAFCANSASHYTAGDAEVMVIFWLLAGLGLAAIINVR